MVFSLAQVQTSCQLWVLLTLLGSWEERWRWGEEPCAHTTGHESLHRSVGVTWVLLQRQSRRPLAHWLSLSLTKITRSFVLTVRFESTRTFQFMCVFLIAVGRDVCGSRLTSSCLCWCCERLLSSKASIWSLPMISDFLSALSFTCVRKLWSVTETSRWVHVSTSHHSDIKMSERRRCLGPTWLDDCRLPSELGPGCVNISKRSVSGNDEVGDQGSVKRGWNYALCYWSAQMGELHQQCRGSWEANHRRVSAVWFCARELW